MGCGLYGKFPGKRDFIAIGAGRGFLSVYEPWLQGGLTASRLALGAGWQPAFLEAPIWRFWLGAGHCGTTVAGALMPSVDGMGRYFPLTVFAEAPPGAAIPPPELDPQDGWFEALEAFLLGALEPELDYATLGARLAALPAPLDGLPTPPPERMLRLSDGSIVSALDSALFPERLAALRAEDQARSFANLACLWTLGGAAYEPLVLLGTKLPDPHLFSGLLTGRFDSFVA